MAGKDGDGPMADRRRVDVDVLLAERGGCDGGGGEPKVLVVVRV